jgi:hypothetical protein
VSELLVALTGHPGIHDELTATMVPLEPHRVGSGSHRAASGEFGRSPSGAVPQPLEPVVKHLAAFIGPIAKITVMRLSKRTADLDELYNEAAKEIDDPEERKKFLRTRPR